MPAFTASKFESRVPDQRIREAMLAIFAASMDFIEARRPEWCHVRFASEGLRLFAGRLIVLTVHEDTVWLAVDPSAAEADLDQLSSWRWDTGRWQRYRRVTSRNGYYSPALDAGTEWASIGRAHYALLERALSSGAAPDPRTAASHDPAVVEYVRRAVAATGPMEVARLPSSSAGADSTSRLASSETSFTHAEVFPIIARMILQTGAQQPNEFVTHDALVSLFLEDAEGADVIRRARAISSFANDRATASNMIAWFSQQMSVGASEWSDFFHRDRVDGAWAYRPVPAATPAGLSASDYRALEGEPRIFFHMRRERDPKIANAKRNAARNSAGELECEACGFVAGAVYGDLAADLCEVHHRRPLGDVVGEVVTQLSDLAILCPTCHRAIHQTRPMLSVEAFRTRYHGGGGEPEAV